QENINELTGEELRLRKELLNTQSLEARADYDRLLAQVQAGKQVTGMRTEKYGGFLGIGRKSRNVEITAGVAGYTYEQLEQLFESGKLDAATAKLFENLRAAKEELDAIADGSADIEALVTDRMTGGITAESISSTIRKGLADGKRSVD